MFFQSHRKISHTPTPEQKPAGPSSKSGRAEIEQQVERITRLVQEKPEKAAKILSDWISRPARKKRDAA